MEVPFIARCPLCRFPVERSSGASSPWLTGRNRLSYLCCRQCSLIFAFPGPGLSAGEERARYLLHRNSIEDAGYLRFLHRLWDPVRVRLSPGMRGLDYGSGPVPVLAEIVRRDGFACDLYDPLFPCAGERPPAAATTPGYDFVLCSEVFEHFNRVGEEVARLLARLSPGGILGVMTEFWSSLESFPRWPYTSDPTHRSFYHPRTFQWIERRFELEELDGDAERVRVFRYGRPVEGIRFPEDRPPEPSPREPEIPPE